jgi:uncharacterized membrane protein YkvA (DUF1232 family)
MSLRVSLKAWAGRVKCDVVAVYFAARDSRTPVVVRLLALMVAAYALSPVDLIPDFIPVLGYLDDLLLVPIGIWLVLRLLPPAVLLESRAKAQAVIARPRSLVAAAAIVGFWLLCAALFGAWLWKAFGH